MPTSCGDVLPTSAAACPAGPRGAPPVSSATGAGAVTNHVNLTRTSMESEMNMNRTALGTVIGLVLGLALAFGSFGQMLIVALFAAIGFGVARVITGELDLSPYLTGRREQR